MANDTCKAAKTEIKKRLSCVILLVMLMAMMPVAQCNGDYLRPDMGLKYPADWLESGYSSVQATSSDRVSAAESDADMLFMLLQIQADVQGNLTDSDSALANAAQELSTLGLEGTAAREVLRKLVETDANLVSGIIFSKDGKITIAAGKGSENAVGADISGQEHIVHLLKAKTPVFSKQLLLVEGYNGTAIAYPVFSPEGEFMGGISAIIAPDKLLNSVVAPQLHFDISSRSNITDYSFWLMHLDGLIAYDRDESQIGKYLFEDPLYQSYPSLLELGHRIAAERSGHGYYSFLETEGDEKVVTKESYWTTAGLHGREWRLVVTKITQ
ncbi:MAG: cache domain-containing protein [Methanotrichaceae archaeon]|nr:cache domain-containing protein [Methanotrichaceae archaeon]